jgi:outer membrane protein insertion porin family
VETLRELPRWLSKWTALAVLALAAAATLAAQVASFEGQRVAELRVVSETGAVLEDNPAGLALAPGKPFSIEAERESLRKLYRTGRYADIRAEATPVAGGVRLDFVVQRNFFIGVVRVEGLREPPSEGKALAAMRLNLGEVFRESAMDGAFDRLQEALREDGFYQSKVARQLHAHADTRQMDVFALVTPGRRAGLGTIRVLNHTEFSDEELVERAKLKPGKELTFQRLVRAGDRVRQFLVKKDHLGARVELRRDDYNPAANAVPLELEVSAGPKVRVVVEGARISRGQLHNLLPIYEEGAVDEDLLQEGRRNLRDYLGREGYFDATVNYEIQNDAKTGTQTIVYQITRGSRHRLVGIAMEGNHYFSGELLRSRLNLQPSGLLERGRFSLPLMQGDADSIQQMYLANGFGQAQVRAEVTDDYAGKKRDLFVRFHVQEGAQTRVASLELAGNHALSDAELLSVIGSAPGQPFSEADVSSDRDNILAFYYNQGFPQAAFQYTATPAGGPDRVALTYRITEGPQVMVDGVLLSGYLHTRPAVIQREVQMQPGEPLRESEVVETQRRLYNLGIFNRVQVAPQNPAGSDPNKTALVEVEEGKRYTIGYGGGIEVQRLGGSSTNPAGSSLAASPRGIFEITKANVGGRVQTVGLKLRASTLQYRGLLSYAVPYFLGQPKFNLLLTGFADKSRDVRTFTSTRYEGSFQVVQNYSRATTFLYRYTFRKVLVSASSLQINPAQIPLFSQPTKISSFGVTWIRDRRDNPADASRGSFNTVDLSTADKRIGSSASFGRLFVQNSTYYPVGRGLVFARSMRLGIEQPYGSSVGIDVPLPERFFAGGGNSLRGFALNQAGPRDPVTGFPLGGLALLVFNQELRFPMHLPFVGDRVGGAAFYDAGNVFSRVGRITLDPSPRSPSDLNYFSHTIGFGFRYNTPIGPVRLDLGYQLNPARFSFANPFTGAPQLSTVPHFQFFFNIGSIF